MNKYTTTEQAIEAGTFAAAEQALREAGIEFTVVEEEPLFPAAETPLAA